MECEQKGSLLCFAFKGSKNGGTDTCNRVAGSTFRVGLGGGGGARRKLLRVKNATDWGRNTCELC